MACGAVFLALTMVMRKSDALPANLPIYLALGMLLCTAIGYFGLQPFMAQLREAAGPAGMEGAARMRFGILHGVASGFNLIQSLLGAALILKLR